MVSARPGGELAQTGGDVDGFAEDVVLVLQHRTVMKADPDIHWRIAARAQLADLEGDADGCIDHRAGLRENRHEAVSSELDHPATIADHHRLHRLEAAIDPRERLTIAEAFVELRAACQVGKQHNTFGGAG